MCRFSKTDYKKNIMTTVTMNNSSRLGQLCPDLLRSIFEFDDTYKALFSKHVLLDIWQTTWNQWHNKLTCPYKYLVMEWLFNQWGVNDNNADESLWFRKHYHVSDVTVVTRFMKIEPVESSEMGDGILLETDNSSDIVGDEENYKCFVCVYMKHKNQIGRIFEGEILTGTQYTADCQKDTEMETQTMDVHWNRMNGLVLYQRFGI